MSFEIHPDYGKVIYCIHEIDVQLEAQRLIGRKLTEEELLHTQKCLQMGLGTSIGLVYRAAIQNATIS